MRESPALTFRILLAMSLMALPQAWVDSTISSTARFAYGANIGWINFRHDQPSSPEGAVFGDHFLAGYAYGANVGWIHFGDGSPTNGIRYQNTTVDDFGVNHDGRGDLDGYAYGANIGWINFDWASPADPNRPMVNLLTGEFSGFAYGANVGWINLGTGELTTLTMAVTDTDGDGITDPWERTFFGDLSTATAVSDSDSDGATDVAEFVANTAPNDAADVFYIVSALFTANYDGAKVTFGSNDSRLYRLEFSDNLGIAPDTWVDSGLGVFASDAGATTLRSISWPSPVSRKFIRAVVNRPLQP